MSEICYPGVGPLCLNLKHTHDDRGEPANKKRKLITVLQEPEPETLVSSPLRKSMIERLPPELYAELLCHMDSTQGIPLSFTCKQLWSQVSLVAKDVLYRVRRCTDINEMLRFLRLLEKDSPKVIMCTSCLMLHRRITNEAEEVVNPGYWKGTRNCSAALGCLSIGELYNRKYITRELLELILRGADLGQEYGLPVETLEASRYWKRHDPCKIRAGLLSTGVVAKSRSGVNCLILKTIYEVEIDLRRDVLTQITESEVRACGHRERNERCLMVLQVELVRHMGEEAPNKKDAQEDDELLAPSTHTYRCSCCPCDMQVVASRKRKKVFARLTVTAWRDLGPRGDHSSLLWRNTIKSYGQNDFNRTDPVTGSLFGDRRLREVYREARKLQEETSE